MAASYGDCRRQRGNQFFRQLPGQGYGNLRAAMGCLDLALRAAQEQEHRPLLRQKRPDPSQATRRVRRDVFLEEVLERVKKITHSARSHLEKAAVGLQLAVQVAGEHDDVLFPQRQGFEGRAGKPYQIHSDGRHSFD